MMLRSLFKVKKQHRPVEGRSPILSHRVSDVSPEKPALTWCFLFFGSPFLTYTPSQHLTRSEQRSPAAAGPPPPRREGAALSAGSPGGLAGSSPHLRAPHVRPAGLTPNGPCSPGPKRPLPPLWVLVFPRFLHSGHPRQARGRGAANTRCASGQRGQRAGAGWGASR